MWISVSTVPSQTTSVNSRKTTFVLLIILTGWHHLGQQGQDIVVFVFLFDMVGIGEYSTKLWWVSDKGGGCDLITHIATFCFICNYILFRWWTPTNLIILYRRLAPCCHVCLQTRPVNLVSPRPWPVALVTKRIHAHSWCQCCFLVQL